MKKTVDFLQKNMFYFIIILIGIAYILTGVSMITRSEETVESIIAASGLGIVLGWLISALFGQQAITDGFLDENLINSINALGEEVSTIEPDITKLEVFCEKDNEITMNRKRTRLLGKVGLKVEVLNDISKDKLKKLPKRQRKAINKAFNIGYGYLSTDYLLADIEESEERNDKPVSVQKYSAKENAKGLVVKIFTGLISGIYVIDTFSKVNVSIILWRVFFFALWLLMGYFRYIKDLNFMTKKYRQAIVKKKNDIIRFRNSLTEHPEWYEIKEEIKEPITPLIESEKTNIEENQDKYLTESIDEVKEVDSKESEAVLNDY
jgi:hypothetical protein